MTEEISQDLEKISWKLYAGERLGFTVTKEKYLYQSRAKTEAGVTRRAILESKNINKPVIVTKRVKHGKEECYKIFFPEGGYIGCEALRKRTIEDYRKKSKNTLMENKND